jgi:predicted deacylase
MKNIIDALVRGACSWERWQATPQACIDLFCCRGNSGGPLAVITAGIHGDEYEGPAAVVELSRQLSPQAISGTVIAVPVANPTAFQSGTRTNPEDNLNLARTFPGDMNGSPTQRLSFQLFQQLALHANLLIDLHSGGLEYVFTPVAGFYGDASSGNLSFMMARQLGLRNLWALPKTAGVLSWECWNRGIVAVGAEYLGAGQLATAGARDYAEGIMRCLMHAGILHGTPAPPLGQTVYSGDWQLAETEGLFVAACSPGQTVSKGAKLAEIIDVRGSVQQSFHAPVAGVVLGLRSKAYIRAGNWGVLLGQPEGTIT